MSRYMYRDGNGKNIPFMNKYEESKNPPPPLRKQNFGLSYKLHENFSIKYLRLDDKIFPVCAPLYRLIDYGQGGILAMRAPIRMKRILHHARMGNIKTLYFWLNGPGHRINPEMMCSIFNKYENENLFHILNVRYTMR